MSSRKNVDENVKRRLYAESMGHCMNPDCQCKLFLGEGNIMEKAHIHAYCDTADNSFENLVVLCPNCHTNFDKNHAFKPEQVLSWKKRRQEEVEKFFSKKYISFEGLKKDVVPLLIQNKLIFENYYEKSNRALWDKIESTILINNRKLKMIFKANLDLFQKNENKYYSNLAFVQQFIAHTEEFETTRGDNEKCREILFPKEINSMFGVVPMEESFIPSTELLELLIKKLKKQGVFGNIVLGLEHPYIVMKENNKNEKIFLDDTPRLRQLYFDYKCNIKTTVRLKSLNFALKYIKSRRIAYEFCNAENLREIYIKNVKMIFIYEYCLSRMFLMQMAPEENSIIVNLHNWNGSSCISTQAYELAEKMNVKLLTMDDFYEYIRKIK